MSRYTITLDIETVEGVPASVLRRAIRLLTTTENGWPKVLHMTVVRTDREGLV